MDDLSKTLMTEMMGCYINKVCFNHLMYADDMVLIAPSAAALQMLVDTCDAYISQNGLQLNNSKSKYVVF